METDPDIRSGVKRKKTAEELSALNDENPELSQSDSLGLTQASKRCGTKFIAILLQEKEKKKISVAALKDLTDCKNTYDEIIDRLIMENMVISGRLAEARINHEVAQVYNRSIISKLADAKVDTILKPSPEKMDTEVPQVSLADELLTATESDAPSTRDPRNKKKKKKKVTIRSPSKAVPSTSGVPTPAPRQTLAVDNSDAPTDTDALDTDDGFRVVRSKKTKRNSRKTTGSDSDHGPTPQQKKEKLERLKNQDVPRTFIIKVEEGKDKNEAKKTLWSEILKKTDTPQIGGTRTTAKGNIIVTVGDDKTYQALKEIANVREDFDVGDRKYPMVMIRDVDINLSTDEIPIYLARQNPSLGLSVAEALECVRPLFRRGPRDRDTTMWVCQVQPRIHAKLMNSHVFIGMHRCRTREYFGYVQCYTCQKYGHREVNCTEKTITCSHCAQQGHRHDACTKLQDPPKCSNCNKPHVATSHLCVERTKAIEKEVRLTDYRDPQL